MADIKELESAFIKADEAGNTEDAQAFATEIKRLRGFESTAGGAAVGNPNLLQQGQKAARTTLGETGAIIGGAGAVGATLNTFAPELLGAAATATRGAPYPFSGLSPFLQLGSDAARATGRTKLALSGAIGGLVGETAGQGMEAGGAPQWASELARLGGGAVGPELGPAAVWMFKNKAGITPLLEYIRSLTGKEVKLSAQQQKYLDEQVLALRGGEKSNQPLEEVGSIMGDRGKQLLDLADQQSIAALNQAGRVGRPAPTGSPMADIGADLQGTILKNNEAALTARDTQFKQNTKLRDFIVSSKEGSKKYINQTPEYEALVAEVNSKLDNSVKMNESLGVQASYRKILDDLTNPEKDVFGQNKALGFNAVDQVRRKLGAAAGFEGKPEQGYDAIPAGIAKDLYFKLREMQVNYAGGKGGPQEKLLSDYRAQSEGLVPFLTKTGKKATALDQHLEGEFAADPSTLPSFYFKTRKTVQDLKELTGNTTQVNRAALNYSDQELTGKNATQARKWMTDNAEWLAEVGPANRVVAKYVDKLEASEVATTRAKDFATKAAADNQLLTRQALPAQRAVDLIKSGDTELWSKVIPAIQQSPQAKTQMVNAVRQVLGDQATSRGTIDLFSRNIRPFLEQSQIATKAEMDFIAKHLESIQKMEIPEAAKLGALKRILLQSTGSWAASAASRGGVNFMSNQVPTEQPYINREQRNPEIGMQGTRG